MPQNLKQTVNSQDIPALTGARGLFAVWIVIGHTHLVHPYFLTSQQWFIRLIETGMFFVDTFFILSGFVISYVYVNRFKTLSRKNYIQFIITRFGRIYPMHFVVLMMYFLLANSGLENVPDNCFPINNCYRFDYNSFIRHLFMVNAWQWRPHVDWNFLAWTVSGEWASYIIFPFIALWPLSRLSNSSKMLLWCIICITVTVMTLYITGINEPAPDKHDVGLIRPVGYFFTGCLMYLFYGSSAYKKINWPIVGYLSVVAILISQYILPNSYLINFLLFFFLLSITYPQGLIVKFLNIRPILFLGQISYSLYMSHLIIIELLNMFVFSKMDLENFSSFEVFCSFIFITIVAIIFSIFTYYLIENPMRLFFKNFAKNRYS